MADLMPHDYVDGEARLDNVTLLGHHDEAFVAGWISTA
jgi:hypothetical protein